MPVIYFERINFIKLIKILGLRAEIFNTKYIIFVWNLFVLLHAAIRNKILLMILSKNVKMKEFL